MMSNKVDEIREQMGKLHKKYNPFTDFNFENDLSIEEYVYHLGDWFKGLLNQFKSLEDTANEVNEQAASSASAAADSAEAAAGSAETAQNIADRFTAGAVNQYWSGKGAGNEPDWLDFPCVTPQMYGAIGDGANDDTEAIQSAINSGQNVFIPAGNYRTTGTILINTVNVILTGDRKATIQPDNGVTKVIEVNGQNTPANRVRTIIRNIRIEGNGTCSGMYLTKGANINVYNVEILGCAVAVWCFDALIFSLYQCDIHNNNKAIYFEGYQGVSAQNCVTFSECHFYGNVVNVLDTPETLAHHMANVNFIACEIEGNGNGTKPLFNIYEGGSSSNRVLTLYGCWFEANNNTKIIYWETDSHTRSIAMYSNVMLSSPNTMDYAIETDNGSLTIIDQTDSTTYTSGSAINITGNGYLNGMGSWLGLPSSVTNNPGLFIGNENRQQLDFSMAPGKKIHIRSQGGTDDNTLDASGNDVRLNADVGNVALRGNKGVYIWNNYTKPLRLEGIRIWVYGKTIYCKAGSDPANYADGSVLITLP